MPVSTPPAQAIAQFLAPTTRHTRRIEIYEADGVTRWSGDTTSRLKDGSVTVDYTRDERRGLDLKLDNSDGGLVNAPGQFWYDKIIKVYRGVQINEVKRLPKVLIIGDSTTNPLAPTLRASLQTLGFGDIRINPSASSYANDVSGYDIVIALGGTDQSALTNAAYAAGKSVFVFRENAGYFYVAMTGTSNYNGANVTSTTGGSIAPIAAADQRNLGWTAFTQSGDTGIVYRSPGVTTSGVFGVAYNVGSTQSFAISSGTNAIGGRYIAVHYPLNAAQFASTQFAMFLLSSMNWLNQVTALASWEVQVGEFMIDRIVAPNRPRELQITGRDYTKKCELSKFAGATAFTGGQTLEALVGALAANAGITKMVLPATGITVSLAFSFDRNTSRWDAMKQICEAYNYEIFFDATGYLIIRPYRDPSTTAPVIYIETGKSGQIASYSKSNTDTELYNHILVAGESSDANVIPVSAQSINTDDSTNTSVNNIGDRYFEYTSPFITTVPQAQALADTLLKIYSLEEFELDFETLLLPWLEVGDIIGFIDPAPSPGDPVTFLLSSLTIPLTLTPMSGVAKRTIIVGGSTAQLNATTIWNKIPDTLTWNQVGSTVTWANLS